MSTQYATFTLAGHLFGVEVRRVQEVLTEQPRTP
ncbi:chemotaxis protein CheW, partial [Kineococcus sp. T90]|nr:chemotaxis protein CheW [Kineococcus indalonis]